MKRYSKQLELRQKKTNELVKKLENRLKSKIDFDFYISYQPSDGWMLGHGDELALLETCLGIIEEKGRLSFEDFDKRSDF